MLTFEKVLKVFQAYLDDDPLYEVVQTSHGYTLMAWEPHRNDWYSAEIQKTPEDLRNALLGTYANFLEDKITGNERGIAPRYRKPQRIYGTLCWVHTPTFWKIKLPETSVN